MQTAVPRLTPGAPLDEHTLRCLAEGVDDMTTAARRALARAANATDGGDFERVLIIYDTLAAATLALARLR